MGKVMFSPVSVCLSTPGRSTPSSADGCTPFNQPQGCPHLAKGGVTTIWLMGGTPIQLAERGVSQGTSHQDWMGYPPPLGLDGDTTSIDNGWGSPPCWDWMRVSPSELDGYIPSLSGDRAAERALAMRRTVCLFLVLKYFHFQYVLYSSTK